MGVHHPIDTANDFVLAPLSTLPNDPEVQAAVAEYQSASASQQAAWTAAYEKAVANANFTDGKLVVPAGDYGPVGTPSSRRSAPTRGPDRAVVARRDDELAVR